MKRSEIDSFVSRQLVEWDDARLRHDALAATETKCVNVNGVEWHVTFNPARSVSTKAKIDASSIKSRRCFLCEANRPEEQVPLKWRGYDILVNPFPVFPGHLTIALCGHENQEILNRIDDFVELACELEGYTVFYNGPHSGASAPDHCHFQAVPEEWLPIGRDYPFRRYYLTGDSSQVKAQMSRVLSSLTTEDGEDEPRVNAAVHCRADGSLEAVIVPRRAHRPSCYGKVGVSPGAIDMLGTVITTSREDYDAVGPELLSVIFSEVATVVDNPVLRVGIMTAPEIHYTLHGEYREEGDTFTPLSNECWFELEDVTIGVNFHWERKERQRFRGALQLMKVEEGVTAVNIIPVEDYLMSVISSEMSAEASQALLRAHAVISRSWVLAQLRHNVTAGCSCSSDDGETVKWYDHDDHTGFDVCADDHCQRYQGITRVTRSEVRDAVMATFGEVMTSGGELCDTRFSKCCGGAFEEFENCWEPEPHSYLTGGRDLIPAGMLPDLRIEAAACDWIMSRPDAFCASATPEILRQVLNDYDRDTVDFYRWKVHYTIEEISEIVCSRSGIDFGEITDLRPLSRGRSGRIYRLEIIGTKCSHIVGKELEIRKWLSRSHLYSSAFVPVKSADGFTLYGAGWGHGVGLCQIGAAVMGASGYDYREILLHYFKNAEINKMY
ncbi:MAG: DUF4922 domain-containing protein [Muribaculum sp.]|nr:DUF4922 domain-containing protein [Muribaculum sp.]